MTEQEKIALLGKIREEAVKKTAHCSNLAYIKFDDKRFRGKKTYGFFCYSSYSGIIIAETAGKNGFFDAQYAGGHVCEFLHQAVFEDAKTGDRLYINAGSDDYVSVIFWIM